MAALFPKRQKMTTDHAPNADFYAALRGVKTIILPDRFQHLRFIRDPIAFRSQHTSTCTIVDSEALNSVYPECTSNFGNTLEEISIIKVQNSWQAFNNIVTLLMQFTRSQKLSVIKCATNALQQFDNAIQACPMVKELKIATIKPHNVEAAQLHSIATIL